jgi:fimbrial isopeptide formation D2 family protein
MTTSMKKTLLISLGLVLTVVLAIAVVYMVRKPTTVVKTPPPTPKASPVESAIAAPIFAVTVADACSATFVVACGSSPSPSPSSSVSPSPSPSSSPSTPPSAALKCVAKKMYEDDTRNRAGFYYLEKEITDTNTLSNGQTIVYNVVSKNAGGSTVPDTTITDKLSENLTYVDGDSGCTYDSSTRIVTCTIGSLSPNSEAQRSFRATVSVAGTTSVANTAEVSSTNGQRDSCSVRIDATGKVVTTATPAPTSLPVAGVFEVTAGTIGISLLLLILGGLGLLLI